MPINEDEPLSGQSRWVLQLTCTNYRDWAKRMRMALELRGLLNTIEGSTDHAGQVKSPITRAAHTLQESDEKVKAKQDLEAPGMLVANVDKSILRPGHATRRALP